MSHDVRRLARNRCASYLRDHRDGRCGYADRALWTRSTDNLLGSHCLRAETGLNPHTSQRASRMLHNENRIAGLLTQIHERVDRYRQPLETTTVRDPTLTSALSGFSDLIPGFCVRRRP